MAVGVAIISQGENTKKKSIAKYITLDQSGTEIW